MPLVMNKTYDIPKQYTPEDKELFMGLIDDFRSRVGDDIPEENILYKKAQRFKDGQIISFYTSALSDINNSGTPQTKFSLQQMCNENVALLVLGAIVMMLGREGIFQAANGIDFNDSGLSIGMYNKSGTFQAWWAPLVSQYTADKKTLKDGIIIKRPNAGFVGINSEFGWRMGGRYSF